ncbi:MAG: hypothetical protein RL189_2701 [Pseudomonadota bacterium]|jgi:hypothetical protein
MKTSANLLGLLGITLLGALLLSSCASDHSSTQERASPAKPPSSASRSDSNGVPELGLTSQTPSDTGDANTQSNENGSPTNSCSKPALPAKQLLNVAYQTISGVEQNLNAIDIYMPAVSNPCEGVPVVIWVHGGAWMIGDKANIDSKATFVNSLGYAFVSVNYRLSPNLKIDSQLNPNRIKFPDHPNDVGAAVAWVHKNIQQHGGNPQKIALLGHSAGAHLAALVTMDQRFIERSTSNWNAKSLRCLGSYDTEAYNIDEFMQTAVGQPLLVYRNAFGDDPTAWTFASPINYIKEYGISVQLAKRGDLARQGQLENFKSALEEKTNSVSVINAQSINHEEVSELIGAPGDQIMTPFVSEFLTQGCFSGEQITDHGTIVYKSVGNGKGKTAPLSENPRKFFQIAYADRFKDKGDCKQGNCYNPSRYLSHPGKKMLITDTVTNPDGREVVLFTATVGGINKETMSFIDPSFKTGNKFIYEQQLAMGWSSADYDADSHSGNCAAAYGKITQHYGSCWNYNLGADAEGDLLDGDWGPHFYKPALPVGAKGMDGDASSYVRVKAITRYIKPLEERTPSFFTEDAALWITPKSKYGTVAYRSVANTNGINASDLQTPRKFFRISYSERLTDKGDCNSGNCYKPSAYEIEPGKRLLVTDTVMGGDGVERVIFSARIGGINKSNMKIINPEFLSGNRSVYDSQLAAGWASYDADFDTQRGNCAQAYGEITQHYSACWTYNLGADAADGGSVSRLLSASQAANWGPHFFASNLPSGSTAERNDVSAYVRVRMITRYVRPID